MALILISCAVAVLGCAPGRAAGRLRVLAPRTVRGHRMTGSRCAAPVVPAAVVVVVFVVAGASCALATTIVVALVMWRWQITRRRRRADRQDDHLLAALAAMIAELSVGAPPARACAVAAAEVRRRDDGDETAVAAALAGMAGRAELGGTIGRTLILSAPGPTDRIAVAWRTAETSGVPMARLLESLRADVAARRAFTDRTRAALAGPRATATVLACLPVLGIVLGQMIGAQPLRILVGGGLGGVLLVTGTALAALGLVWSERITGRVLG